MLESAPGHRGDDRALFQPQIIQKMIALVSDSALDRIEDDRVVLSLQTIQEIVELMCCLLQIVQETTESFSRSRLYRRQSSLFGICSRSYRRRSSPLHLLNAYIGDSQEYFSSHCLGGRAPTECWAKKFHRPLENVALLSQLPNWRHRQMVKYTISLSLLFLPVGGHCQWLADPFLVPGS